MVTKNCLLIAFNNVEVIPLRNMNITTHINTLKHIVASKYSEPNTMLIISYEYIADPTAMGTDEMLVF